MFLGHFAVAFAAKRVAPKISLGGLVGAALFLDLVWPIFLLLGWERVAIRPGITAVNDFNFLSYPLSHSLAGAVIWGTLFAGVYWLASGHSGGAGILVAVVASHWFLDALTHRPDLPLYPGGPKVGLGLWHSVPATIAVEVPMYLLAVWLYRRCTKYGHWAGRYGLWTLVAGLFVLYFAALAGPPPPSEKALALFSLSGFLLPVAAWWADRHRVWSGCQTEAR